MESLTKLTGLQVQGQHIVDIIKAHPWTSLGVAAGTALVWSYVRAPRNLPPGPKGLPWVGAISCFTADLPQKLLEWRQDYGEIISFYKCGRLHIILNSEQIIREAFVKRTEEFGPKGSPDKMVELGFDDDISAAPYDEAWKKRKKFAVTTLKCYGFGTKLSEAKIQDQLLHLESFLHKTNNTPVDIEEEAKLFSAAILSTIMFGGSPTRNDADTAEMIRLVSVWYGALSEVAMADAKYEDFLHPSITMSLARGSRRNLCLALKDLKEFLTQKVNNAAKDITNRDAECYVDACLKEQGQDAITINTIVKNIATMLGDGIFTMSMVDAWCLLYTTFYPEVQKQLHKEITTICPSGKLPSLADRPKMPFAQAVVFETLRLSMTLQMSLDRELQQDVTLAGYNLPKGALVSANFYAVHFDANLFPDPYGFNPSRFINSDGKFDTSLAAKIMTFSVGNRMCLGEAYAKAHIFLLLTRLVQRFELLHDPSVPTPKLEKNAEYIANKPQSIKICFKAR